MPPPSGRRISGSGRVLVASVGLMAVTLSCYAKPATASSTSRHVVKKAIDVDPFTTPAMHAYLEQRVGSISGAIYDLKDDKTYLYRPSYTGQTASIIKADILETLLHQAEVAHRSLTSGQKTVATGMIEQSDNDDATDLWDAIGGSSGIASYNAKAGLTDTKPNTQGLWGITTTTALDQIRILQHLVLPNDLLDTASRDYELGLMRNVITYDSWGVPSGVPVGVSVAVKNGWVPIVYNDWQINSIGYVDGKGESYLLAILTSSNKTEDYGIDTTDGIAGLVWKELVNSGQ